ncbi:uncharacterized protein MELLADRAFT_37249 [Melampsora larici-populina 98AG31]|uniref:Uncharacterized protein n=1 Tax=Melampsora larici-populina (strain 98AG31 / pathotype 3-4-7) TaxID=747676 RepID=F4RSA8_MELLP|nr:uncharacterized protein MELLADRAFT_37249 [Melampsora larici-populina 98AG31]EGG04564.1 hypothetical protein MELLADRAFT_37249 [Melampsora larici-populina 98AG31]
MKINTLFDVKGRTAVITGGGSGLGEMMAHAWVQNGGHVIIASRKEKALSKVCDELNSLKTGKAEYVVGDVSTKAGCVALCDKIKEKVNKIHVLVNNSGVSWGAPYDDVPEKEGWDRVLGMNVKSIFYMTSELTSLLAKDATNIDPGRVIIISSVAGVASIAESTGLGAQGHGLWSYNASKAAAISLSNNLAVTLGPKFITVNAICPGVYPSRMTAYGMKVAGDALAQSHPMGRYGTPEDMAGIFLFLTSRAGAHISANVSNLNVSISLFELKIDRRSLYGFDFS